MGSPRHDRPIGQLSAAVGRVVSAAVQRPTDTGLARVGNAFDQVVCAHPTRNYQF